MLNVGVASQPIVFLRMLALWANLRRRLKADFVHATTWRLALPTFAAFTRGPCAVTVHAREVLIVPKPLRPVMRFILERADLVLGVSRTSLDAARRSVPCPRGTWIENHNGLSFAAHEFTTAEVARNTRLDQPLIVYTVCRLVERKNVQGALRALGILHRRGVSNFRYRIGGTGPMRPVLQAISKEEGLSDVVDFMGFVPEEDLITRYIEADIFLHPQIAAEGGGDLEGFGLTIADAMSLGAAAVAGRDGGPADFVQNGITGLVVDGNDPSAIADAIELLVSDNAERRRIAIAGREWCLKSLSWDKHAASICKAVSKE